ncbi:iron complex transport system permease protein [Serratia sp. PL17]|uniref:FecCD family ABC transporter permease n=1 Tax=Serratia sp. PL17 TaxID=2806582 RepID=UPI001AE93ED4|nr:iron ABC transporter permease [Serratia sp. PL17]MBP1131193.1 iron complex transport system permease protein [Serratia sp. PL17]
MPDRKKYAAIMAGLSVVLCLVAVASLFVGRYSLSVDEIMQVLLHAKLSAKDEANYSVIFSLRMPRVIAVMMVGGGLSVAGATFQAVLKNSLASPDVLGTSSASAFGAALGILFSFPFALSSLCSLFFGILSLVLVFGICHLKKRQDELTTILSGIIIASVFVSFISIIKYVADPQDTLPAIVFWLMGSFASVLKEQVYWLIPLYAISYFAIYTLRWKMNIISLGDDEAKIAGLNPQRIKVALLFLSAVLVSASVTIAGVVGWVGLVIPHLIRSVLGCNHGRLIPASALGGALFLLIIDNIARSATYAEIPIGILTALIGAPLFALLFIMSRRYDNS